MQRAILIVSIAAVSFFVSRVAEAQSGRCCCGTGIDAKEGAFDDFPRAHCDCTQSPPGSCHYREASSRIFAAMGITDYRLVPTTPNRAYIDLIGPNGTDREADIRGRFTLLGPDGEGFAMYQLDWQGQSTKLGFNLSAKRLKMVNWQGQEQVLEVIDDSAPVGVPPIWATIRGEGVQPSPHAPLVTMLMDEMSPAMDALNAGGLDIGMVHQGIWQVTRGITGHRGFA